MKQAPADICFILRNAHQKSASLPAFVWPTPTPTRTHDARRSPRCLRAVCVVSSVARRALVATDTIIYRSFSGA